MTDLIKRAEQAAEITAIDFPQSSQTIRDLIAALQAAPTAEQLRGWAKRNAEMDGPTPISVGLMLTANRMEGK